MKQELVALAKANASPFRPSRNSACLCGSMLKFKRCCGALKLDGNSLDRYYAARNSGDLQEALRQIRCHVTWYRMCHLRHTVPLVRANKAAGEEILAIDIEALGDCIEDLIRCHLDLGIEAALQTAIKSLEHAIDDVRWVSKYQLFCVLAALGNDWNERKAAAVIKGFYSDPEKINDFTLLSMFSDFCSGELSPYKRHRAAERLAMLAKRPVDRLHYQIGSEIALLMLGEDAGIADRIAGHIQEFRDATADRAHTQEEADWLSQALSTLATFDPSEDAISAAESATTALLVLPWSDLGKGRLYRRLAEIAKVASQYDKAASHFQTAFTYTKSHTDLMFASECLLFYRDVSGAQLLFNRVKFEELDESGKLDYALVLPGFAMEGEDIASIERSKTILLETKFHDPYFHDQRVIALQILEKRLSNINHGCAPDLRPSRFKRMLQVINSYAELKPNVMGFGININALLDRAIGQGTKLHDDSEGR